MVPAILYKASLDNPFVFDDRVTVLLNASLVDPFDLRGVLLHNLARPVVNISYAIDRAIWGFSSFGFHLTNGLLHILVVGLFYGWCTRALADGVTRLRPEGATAGRGPGPGRGQTRVRSRSDRGLTPGVEWPAVCAAAVFAVHPLMGAAVSYVSARSELLAAAGVLAALTFARRAIVTSSTTAGLIAAAFGLLAVASSASAALLPLLVLAYDAWVRRDPGYRRRALVIYLPALVAIALLFVAWRLPGLLAADRVPPRGLAGNLLTEAIVIWRYVWLLVAPYGQALVHQVRWVTSPVDTAGILALATLAASVAAAVHVRHSRPLVAFGVVWFITVLAPASSLIPLRDAMAEHRAYLASAGLFLAGASALSGVLAARRVARAGAIGVVLLLGVQSFQRNRFWSDPVRLWEEAVERSPDAWQARLGYAELLREIHRCDRAASEYREVLRLNAGQPDAIAGLEACR